MTSNPIPALYFDGTTVDVLWDNHDAAIDWYRRHMAWEIGQSENWKPDPRCTQGRMTRLNWGTWLISSLTSERLPHHYAERGTVESNVRQCWRTRDIKSVHRRFQADGIRLSDLYRGPGNTQYFDFWATNEGIRFTAQEDSSVQEEGFVPSWVRIGVRDLTQSVDWYRRYMGMEIENDYSEYGFVIMSLGLNHQQDQKSLWVLEQLPEGAPTGKVSGQVWPVCWIAGREDLFQYRTHLIDNGIEASEVGGFLTRGLVSFHFYDPDGNRLNVSSM